MAIRGINVGLLVDLCNNVCSSPLRASKPFSCYVASVMKYFQGWARGAKLIVYCENEFNGIKIPVLILLGENDPIYKKTSSKELVDKLNKLRPNIIAETIPGSHGFPILYANTVNEKIISFMIE